MVPTPSPSARVTYCMLCQSDRVQVPPCGLLRLDIHRTQLGLACYYPNSGRLNVKVPSFCLILNASSRFRAGSCSSSDIQGDLSAYGVFHTRLLLLYAASGEGGGQGSCAAKDLGKKLPRDGHFRNLEDRPEGWLLLRCDIPPAMRSSCAARPAIL